MYEDQLREIVCGCWGSKDKFCIKLMELFFFNASDQSGAGVCSRSLGSILFCHGARPVGKWRWPKCNWETGKSRKQWKWTFILACWLLCRFLYFEGSGVGYTWFNPLLTLLLRSHFVVKLTDWSCYRDTCGISRTERKNWKKVRYIFFVSKSFPLAFCLFGYSGLQF